MLSADDKGCHLTQGGKMLSCVVFISPQRGPIDLDEKLHYLVTAISRLCFSPAIFYDRINNKKQSRKIILVSPKAFSVWQMNHDSQETRKRTLWTRNKAGHACIHTCRLIFFSLSFIIWASTRENLSFGLNLPTTQVQISLGIHTVWSAPLLFAFWKVSYVNLLQVFWLVSLTNSS